MSISNVNTNTATINSTSTVKAFCSDNEVTNVSKVRINTNGYPFITFLYKAIDPATNKNKAENIYFSKGLAEELSPQAGDAPSILVGKNIIELVNDETGEVRKKISRSGSTDYVSVDDLFA